MQELDPRIVRVGIEVNGKLKVYEGLEIHASGTKFANANENECEVKISNLNKETRDYILTETSPFNSNRTPKRIIVEAGRKSYGYAQIFIGDIVSAVPSQPPDISLTIKAKTGNFQKGKIVSKTSQGRAKLSNLAGNAAKDMGLTLYFQAKNKDISNFNFTGAAIKQVDDLGEAGGVDVFIDDNKLVVKDANIPLTNKLRILALDTGMIGIPEITEKGIKVKFLLDNQTTLGGGLRIDSKIYPSANGDYSIYKLGFEIASRDTPFYWIAEGIRL